jgi:hypothetical protein
MTASGSRTPMSPRELALDEALLDMSRGRVNCPVHRDQQMMPLLPGKDFCPLPHGEDEPQP